MYKRAVPSARRRNADHRQCSEIAQAKYACEFQEIEKEGVFQNVKYIN